MAWFEEGKKEGGWQLSRRDFLGVGLGLVGAASVLSGCDVPFIGDKSSQAEMKGDKGLEMNDEAHQVLREVGLGLVASIVKAGGRSSQSSPELFTNRGGNSCVVGEVTLNRKNSELVVHVESRNEVGGEREFVTIRYSLEKNDSILSPSASLRQGAIVSALEGENTKALSFSARYVPRPDIDQGAVVKPGELVRVSMVPGIDEQPRVEVGGKDITTIDASAGSDDANNQRNGVLNTALSYLQLAQKRFDELATSK